MDKKYSFSCVALGNFDGIHVGHDVLIKKMIQISREKKQNSIIMTFRFVDKNLPKSSRNLEHINNFNSKLEMLKKYNATEVVDIELDETISKYTPEEFIKYILIDKFNVKNIVIGYNFKFGHKASGDIKTLKFFEDKYGYKVEEIEPVKYNGIAVSSTLIRKLIHEGKIKEANNLLTRNYSIDIEDLVIDYNRNLAFVNNKSNIIIPRDGVYKILIEENEMKMSICKRNGKSIFLFDKKIDENIKNKSIVFVN